VYDVSGGGGEGEGKGEGGGVGVGRGQCIGMGGARSLRCWEGLGEWGSRVDAMARNGNRDLSWPIRTRRSPLTETGSIRGRN